MTSLCTVEFDSCTLGSSRTVSRNITTLHCQIQEVGERTRELGSPDVLVMPKPTSASGSWSRKWNALGNVKGVNYWGSVYATHFALPHLKRSRGKIVVNASAAGWLPVPRMSFYNTLRIEFRSDVKITIATPGWTESAEMSKGKFLSKEDEMLVVQEIRDSPELLRGMRPPCMKILDAIGAKKYLYPDTIQSPVAKRD